MSFVRSEKFTDHLQSAMLLAIAPSLVTILGSSAVTAESVSDESFILIDVFFWWIQLDVLMGDDYRRPYRGSLRQGSGRER